MKSKVSFLIACGLVVALAPVALGRGAVKVHAARSAPPVIRESFTPLPCGGAPHSRTTLQMEGCAEHQILKTDATLNALDKTVFSLLRDNAAKTRFVKAIDAWLAYRRADCTSMSDVFEGGSQAPVVFAQCEAARNGTRIGNLRSFKKALSSG